MRSLIVIAALAASMSASAVTATKEWVQSATNDVLREAKAYADAKPSAPVSSVNGKTGAVNLRSYDVGALSTEGGTVTGPIVMYTNLDPVYLQVGAGGYGGFLEVFSGFNQPASIKKDGKEVATESQVAEVGNLVDALGSIVNAWQTYWDGDDVRVTVTNYFGSMGTPSLYIEQKMPADGDHDAPWFKTVWDERTRWNAFLPVFHAVTNEVAQNKADRAWGVYDSSSGEYSPDGLLQLSQDEIMISGGMSWQKTVTAGGCSCWILKATTPTTFSGRLEDGFFRILDADGSPLLEIVKGDKRIVPATASALSVDGGVMTVSYNVEAADHPVMEVCTDLKAAAWQSENAATVARVSWSGSSGAWVATVEPVGAPRSMFARATYEAGGNTYIRNHVAVSTDKVVIGGVEYSVTVETVDGRKLMVLR